MSDRSKIAWCDATWNCVRGCSEVSPGCARCYARNVAARFSGPGQPYEGLATRSPARWTGKVALVEDHLSLPLRWRKPRRIFVNSMSDLFHESLPDEAIDRVFAVMALAPWHRFQILTKRAERMRAYCEARARGRRDSTDAVFRVANAAGMREFTHSCFNPISGAWEKPLPNVWLGVSAEDQQRADERIPLLLQTPAAVRFVSAEPLLEQVNLAPYFGAQPYENRTPMGPMMSPGLDLVIVGGESGPGARPCDIAWIRSIVGQCKAAGVSCFVKQLGARAMEEFAPGCDRLVTFKDRKGADPAEWPEDLRVQEFPR